MLSSWSSFLRVSAIPSSRLVFDPLSRVSPLSRADSALGRDVSIGTQLQEDELEGTRRTVARVRSTPESDEAHREAFARWLDGAELVGFRMVARDGADAHFFVKDDAWPGSSEDVAQLRRLGAGRLNLTLHEGQDVSTPGKKAKKVLDVKAHLPGGVAGAVVTVRYGSDAATETARLLRHALKATARKAWLREKERAREQLKAAGRSKGGGGRTDVVIGERRWSRAEAEQLLAKGFVAGYDAVFARDAEEFPELATDLDNVRFVKRKKAGRKSG